MPEHRLAKARALYPEDWVYQPPQGTAWHHAAVELAPLWDRLADEWAAECRKDLEPTKVGDVVRIMVPRRVTDYYYAPEPPQASIERERHYERVAFGPTE